MIEGEPYRYQGQPLTPAIIETLIRELFSGQIVQRQTIVDGVSRAHLARGGTPGGAQSAAGSVKKALSTMRRQGLAENPSHGHWRIAATESGTEPSEAPAHATVFCDAEAAGQPALDEASEPALIADLELGTGQGAVYVYYLPTYRHHALERGEHVWFCKIGRTERDPLQRILAQAATALPERPRIALMLRTDAAPVWETALQAVLTLRGRKADNSPGSEWFLTSPDEVLALIELLDPTLAGSRRSVESDEQDSA